MELLEKYLPNKEMLFDVREDLFGKRLPLIFGNENGICPFYGQCKFCVIGSGEKDENGKIIKFNPLINKKRLEAFRRYYGGILDKINHLVIYNSGSTMNEREMSTNTLNEIIKFANSLPNLKAISFDTRPEFVNENKIKKLSESFNNKEVYFTIGLEAGDRKLRHWVLGKTIKEEDIENLLELSKNYSNVGLELNIMYKHPGVRNREEAFEDAKKIIDYGLNLSEKFKKPVLFNFHPFCHNIKTSFLFEGHKEPSSKESFEDYLKLLEYTNHRINSSNLLLQVYGEKAGKNIIYYGDNDEGLKIEYKER